MTRLLETPSSWCTMIVLKLGNHVVQMNVVLAVCCPAASTQNGDCTDVAVVERRRSCQKLA